MKILLDNSDFIILEKPCGISFHSEEGPGFMSQVQEFLGYSVFSVHRLDKVTSGVIIFAKSSESASIFGELFRENKMKKTYLALAKGKPSKKQGWIKGDMIKSRRGSYKLLRSFEKPAITQFTSELLEPGLRLYTLKPHTGRTHQLRVAMKSLGVPILGDKLYGGESYGRVCLHSYDVAFNFKNKQYRATSDIDW